MTPLSKTIASCFYAFFLCFVIITPFNSAEAKLAPLEDHSFKGKAKKRAASRAIYKKHDPAAQKKRVKKSKRVSMPASTASKNKNDVVVKKGDTLYAISRKYQVSVKSLIQENQLKSPYTLTIGQHITLPKPHFHIVHKGETVYGISRQYDMDMNRLVKLNHIKAPYILSIGQKLIVNPKAVHTHKKPHFSRQKPTQIASLKQPVAPQKKSNMKRQITKVTPKRASKHFAWPVRGKIISNYGTKKNGLHNDGINIHAPKGAKVFSSENGIVEYVGGMKGFDNLVIIRHDGYMTAYAHLGKITISRGSRVSKGGLIGTVGQKGNVPQIHFEIRRGKKAINPVTLLR